VKFVVEGAPVPKERPRFNTKTGRVYTPRKTKTAEDHIAWEFKRHYGAKLLTQDVHVCLSFHLEKGQRADLDNLVKTVLDALNGVAWKDDAQVIGLECRIYRDCSKAGIKVDIVEAKAQRAIL
jgi:crossover junction endodeoxyribonuclease RusA